MPTLEINKQEHSTATTKGNHDRELEQSLTKDRFITLPQPS